jgi:NAD(P)-dependent dehydrogenase (short-subunit alcohol dehydrogenase family)
MLSHLKEENRMGVYDCAGRKALVTGGARGLGAGMAEALARSGAAVVIGDVREDLGKETADQLSKSGATAAFVPLDVTDDASWEQAISATISELGGLDIVINNAGVEFSSLVVDLDPADVMRMLEVNVLGTALGIKHAFRAMRPGGPAGQGGAVVNISSVAATIAFPGIAGYSATKSAVDRLTRVAAMESGKLGYGVRVNCIYPGLVPTEMGNQLAQDMVTLGLFPNIEDCVGAVVGLTPHGRLGEVAEVADAVVFLASDGARFVTGAGLPVDGGMGM